CPSFQHSSPFHGEGDHEVVEGATPPSPDVPPPPPSRRLTAPIHLPMKRAGKHASIRPHRRHPFQLASPQRRRLNRTRRQHPPFLQRQPPEPLRRYAHPRRRLQHLSPLSVQESHAAAANAFATASAASRGSTAALAKPSANTPAPPPRNKAASTAIRSRADSPFIRSTSPAIPAVPSPVSISARAPSVRHSLRSAPASTAVASPRTPLVIVFPPHVVG